MKQTNNSVIDKPEPILPDGSPEIVFNLATPFRRFYAGDIETQPQSIVVGQMNRFVLIEPSENVDLFGVRFEPFGLSPFIKESLNELTDKIETLDSVFNKLGNEIEERINQALTIQERIAIFEKTFEKLLLNNKYKENQLNKAVEVILKNNGQISIKHLSNRLGTNIKQLERLFKRKVGLTPKKFGRIIRLQQIAQFMSEQNVENWADVAYSFGYYDQSHFIRDFKNFSGNSPDLFSKQETQITNFFVDG